MTLPVPDAWLRYARSGTPERKDLVRVYTDRATWYSYCSGSAPVIYGDGTKVLTDAFTVAFDETNQKVYYTSVANRDQVRRCNPDGTDDENVFTVATAQMWYLALDEVNQHVYVTDIFNDQILKYGFDGIVHADSPVASSLNNPRGICIDTRSDTPALYYCNSDANEIRTCELDGSNSAQVLVVTAPYSIDIDQENGVLYYTRSGQIRKVNTDGTGDTTLSTGLSDPRGIHFEQQTNRLYVVDTSAATLHRFQTDGSNKEDLASGLSISPVDVLVSRSGVLYEPDQTGGLWRQTVPHETDRATASVRGIVSTPGRLDPISRRMSVSAFDVVFDDDEHIKQLIRASQLKGKKVEVLLGFEGLVPEDWAPQIVGVIDDWICEPGTVTLRCLNLYAVLGRKLITVGAANRHPAMLCRDMAELGLPDWHLNRDSFDPSRSSNLTSVGHYNVNMLLDWKADRTVHSPTSALDVIGELAREMNSGLIFDEDGSVRFLRYDPSASSAGTLTADDIVRGSIKIISSVGNMRSQVDVMYSWEGRTETPLGYGATIPDGRGMKYIYEWPMANISLLPYAYDNGGAGGFARRYTHKDSTAESETAFPGAATTENVLTITDKWLSAELRIGGPTSSPDLSKTGAITLDCYTPGGATGTGHYDGISVPSWAQTGASNPAYFLLYNRQAPWIQEIVKCDNAATVTSTAYVFNPNEANFNGFGEYENLDIAPIGSGESLPFLVSYSIDAGDRAQLGTSAPDNNFPGEVTGIVDITAAVQTAADALGRVYQGSPVIEWRCYFESWRYQVGDLLTLDATDFGDARYLLATYTIDDLDGTVWEVLTKELSQDGVRFILCYVKTSPSLNSSYASRVEGEGTADTWLHASFEDDDFIGNAILRGFGVTDSGGLTVDIAAGFAKVGGLFTRKNGLSTHSVTASKDTYFSWDAVARMVVAREYALASGTPNIPTRREIMLAKVVSGASTISSITSLAPTTFLDGANLDDGTVDTTQLASEAVESGKIASDAVTSYNIDPISALSGNMIPNGEFAYYSATRGNPDKWYAVTGTFGVEIGVQEGSGGLTGGVYLEMGDPSTAPSVKSALVACEEGQPHQIEVNVSASGTAVTATAQIQWYTDADVLVSTDTMTDLNGATMAVANTWYNFREVFVAPSTARKFLVVLSAGTHLTQLVRWDYASVTRSPVSFSAYHNTTQSVTSTPAQVSFNTEDHDSGAVFASSTFTAKKQGPHRFGAGLLIQSVNAGDTCSLWIYVNGSLKKRLDYQKNEHASAAADKFLKGVAEFKLSAGDTVDIYAACDSTETASGGEDEAYFWGESRL